MKNNFFDLMVMDSGVNKEGSVTNKFGEKLWIDPVYEDKCLSYEFLPKPPTLEKVFHN